METDKTVAIILCTHNGERHLEEQLRSIAHQTYPNWHVIISDDGSDDRTLDIIEHARRTYMENRLQLRRGPRTGFAFNFLSILEYEEPPGDYVAYADQDDIWEPEKLAIAVSRLSQLPEERPALFGGRTLLIDEDGAELGPSPLFKRPPHFRNALVQNIYGGNTMVMNRAGWKLLKQARGPEVVSHDWWTYQVISGAGGSIIVETRPLVRYRQHDNNLIGAKTSLRDKINRIGILFKGHFRAWNEINIRALQFAAHLLTPENRRALEHYAQARNTGLAKRLLLLRRSGAYRQTLAGTISLWLAVVLKKL